MMGLVGSLTIPLGKKFGRSSWALPFFELKMDNSVETIDIISIDGKLMETLLINSSKTIIDMSNYARGTYIAKITLSDNKTIVSRITK